MITWLSELIVEWCAWVIWQLYTAANACYHSHHDCLYSLLAVMHESSVAVSDSLGQVGVMELCPTGPRLLQVWRAHSYEAWIVCFGKSSDILFSGGDDCRLHCWDLRKGTDTPSASSKW